MPFTHSTTHKDLIELLIQLKDHKEVYVNTRKMIAILYFHLDDPIEESKLTIEEDPKVPNQWWASINKKVTHAWSKDWPTEEGSYWFYGKKYTYSLEPELYFVRVHKIRNGFTYVLEGLFYYPQESGGGQWKRIDLPTKPIDN